MKLLRVCSSLTGKRMSSPGHIETKSILVGHGDLDSFSMGGFLPRWHRHIQKSFEEECQKRIGVATYDGSCSARNERNPRKIMCRV